MKTRLDINTWNHREHFNLFNSFEEPFFSFTVAIDCTAAYSKAKELGVSLFLYYLYQSMAAANQIEPFRYRIENNNEVYVHDVVSASPTIMRPNGTFGFGYLEFVAAAKPEIEKVQQSSALFPDKAAENLIHYSAIPWLNFTGLTHARNYRINDGVPKISFGKITENNGRKSFPVSITVHHGLMDGIHVGQYAELFQELMNS